MAFRGKIICVICSLFLIITIVFILFERRSSFAEQSLPIVVTGISGNQSSTENTPSPSLTSTKISENSQVNSVTNSSTDARFLSSAARNSQLKFNVKWAFGGKTQRGWFIYAKLISQLIGTEANVDSPKFAAALARWQETNGLPPSGI